MKSQYIFKQCPVCGYSVAKMVFNAGVKPLATIAWAKTQTEAKGVQTFRQEYIQCLNCSHVWNHLFDWDNVPYQDKPNNMYNNGSQWVEHTERLKEWLSNQISMNPTIIDIGCGDGNFLINMANQYNLKGNFLGFDPSGNVNVEQSKITFNRSLFRPLEDTANYKPDLILMRHVIEHLTAPSSFLHSLAWGASSYEKKTYLYCEVPCIDRVFATGRLSDFYYEHPSQFTTSSFTKMLTTSGRVVDIHHVYDGEVICGLIELTPSIYQTRISRSADTYCSELSSSIKRISNDLKKRIEDGELMAIWGGTGKCAAFMHHYQISCTDIPVVVDSDERKWGTHVPGVGQEIKQPSYLLKHPIRILIIPTQWRAQDILLEAKSLGIEYTQALIEHEGKLIDFIHDSHPYDKTKLVELMQ